MKKLVKICAFGLFVGLHNSVACNDSVLWKIPGYKEMCFPLQGDAAGALSKAVVVFSERSSSPLSKYELNCYENDTHYYVLFRNATEGEAHPGFEMTFFKDSLDLDIYRQSSAHFPIKKLKKQPWHELTELDEVPWRIQFSHIKSETLLGNGPYKICLVEGFNEERITRNWDWDNWDNWAVFITYSRCKDRPDMDVPFFSKWYARDDMPEGLSEKEVKDIASYDSEKMRVTFSLGATNISYNLPKPEELPVMKVPIVKELKERIKREKESSNTL